MDALYPIVLTIHSVMRWFVLLAGAAAVVQSLVSLVSGGTFLKRHKLSNLAFMIFVDLHLLLGSILYFVLSPITRAAFADFGGAMKEAAIRYWAVEHITGMILGFILLHVAYFLGKRAKTDKGKFIWGGIGLGLALLVIIGSIPWPFMAAGRPLF
ncbi:MAG: hypothetical protein AB8H79_22835 [Myxococcota bacterium]